VESLAGRLLISSPSLVDRNFRRTVVLMTHHDPEGAVGLVLSRPSELAISEALPDLFGELPWADEVVYVGGPVQPEAVVVLVDVDDPAGVTPIIGGVAYLPPGADTTELSVSRARVFAGYSGWGPGQLEQELQEEAWIVAGALPDDVFSPDPDVLWRSVLERMGRRFNLMAAMPLDPTMN